MTPSRLGPQILRAALIGLVSGVVIVAIWLPLAIFRYRDRALLFFLINLGALLLLPIAGAVCGSIVGWVAWFIHKDITGVPRAMLLGAIVMAIVETCIFCPWTDFGVGGAM